MSEVGLRNEKPRDRREAWETDCVTGALFSFFRSFFLFRNVSHQQAFALLDQSHPIMPSVLGALTKKAQAAKSKIRSQWRVSPRFISLAKGRVISESANTKTRTTIRIRSVRTYLVETVQKRGTQRWLRTPTSITLLQK